MTTPLLLATSPLSLPASRPDRDEVECLADQHTPDHRCPHCQGVIYSRRFATCRDCGEELPATHRLHRAAAALVEAELEGSRARLGQLRNSLAAAGNRWSFAI